jgi:hypothetical protein
LLRNKRIAEKFRKEVREQMKELRTSVDEVRSLTVEYWLTADKKAWPAAAVALKAELNRLSRLTQAVATSGLEIDTGALVADVRSFATGGDFEKKDSNTLASRRGTRGRRGWRVRGSDWRGGHRVLQRVQTNQSQQEPGVAATSWPSVSSKRRFLGRQAIECLFRRHFVARPAAAGRTASRPSSPIQDPRTAAAMATRAPV